MQMEKREGYKMRSAKKAVEEYKKRFYKNNPTNKGCMYATDLYQVHELGKGQVWECINIALQVGFIYGMRYAERERKRG